MSDLSKLFGAQDIEIGNIALADLMRMRVPPLPLFTCSASLLRANCQSQAANRPATMKALSNLPAPQSRGQLDRDSKTLK